MRKPSDIHQHGALVESTSRSPCAVAAHVVCAETYFLYWLHETSTMLHIMLGIMIVVLIIGAMRVRVLEDKVAMLRRAMDRQLTEPDVEYMLKMAREQGVDRIEERMRWLEAHIAEK